MREHTIPAPGTDRGPCDAEGCGPRCRKRMACFTLREEAATPCEVCGKRAGYGVLLLVREGEFVDFFTHKACAEGAAQAA